MFENKTTHLNSYKLNCIKCNEPYESSDPDPFYCPKCEEEKKVLALEVDKKMSARPKKVVISALREYDLARGKMPFAPIKNLGIKL